MELKKETTRANSHPVQDYRIILSHCTYYSRNSITIIIRKTNK